MGLDRLSHFEIDEQQTSFAPHHFLNLEENLSENNALKVLKFCLKDEQNEDENLSIDKQLTIRRLLRKPFCRSEMINELKTLTTAEASVCFHVLLNFMQKSFFTSKVEEEFSNFEELIDFISMLIDAHSLILWKNDIFREDLLHLNDVNLCMIFLTDVFRKRRVALKRKTNPVSCLSKKADYVIETLKF